MAFFRFKSTRNGRVAVTVAESRRIRGTRTPRVRDIAHLAELPRNLVPPKGERHEAGGWLLNEVIAAAEEELSWLRNQAAELDAEAREQLPDSFELAERPRVSRNPRTILRELREVLDLGFQLGRAGRWAQTEVTYPLVDSLVRESQAGHYWRTRDLVDKLRSRASSVELRLMKLMQAKTKLDRMPIPPPTL